jgi:hypothetical protein
MRALNALRLPASRGFMRSNLLRRIRFRASGRFPLIAALGVVAFLLAVPARLGRANAPAGQYSVIENTVVDTKTSLNWSQSLATSTFAWNDAVSYCSMLPLQGGGWRLPSQNELQTLVDETRAHPSIDPTAFPSTPSDFFWTSSTVPSFPQYAWAISFDSGVTTLLTETQTAWVRCVRP